MTQPMPRDLTIEFRLLILKHLPLNQATLANRTYGDRRWAGEAATAISAKTS
jgi:hypothetical protein